SRLRGTKMNKTAMILCLVLLSSEASVADTAEDTISSRITALSPGTKVTRINDSAVEGIKEVLVNGKEFMYATEDGRYIFSGKLIEIKDDLFVDLTEQSMQEVRRVAIDHIDISKTITFPADHENHEIF